MFTDDCHRPTQVSVAVGASRSPPGESLRLSTAGLPRLDRPDGVYRPQSCKTRVCSGLAGVAGSVVWGERPISLASRSAVLLLPRPGPRGAMKLDLGSQRSVRPVPSPDYRDFYCCDTPTFMTPSGTLLLVREHLIIAHMFDARVGVIP